ncbi:hypothetical protein SAMN06265360_1651 [Haloechinothrix alba]|uniref:Uncharacterized protein n=1 Tax=Haloechinothrix alba TaxID=664784 RepID=A0A239AXK1_9PSEU|nr:hypothetical protein SAMN06265360_1651 [Haloechinothrix alba]
MCGVACGASSGGQALEDFDRSSITADAYAVARRNCTAILVGRDHARHRKLTRDHSGVTEHAAMSTIRALRMNMIDNQRGLAVSALEPDFCHVRRVLTSATC